MGHEITGRVQVGRCELTRCSCGRGALRVRDKVLLVSRRDLEELTGIFAPGGKGRGAASPIAVRLNGLTDGGDWTDFTPGV
jgi:hypothetical protein